MASSKNEKLLNILIVVALIVAGVLGGFILFAKQSTISSQPASSPTPTPLPSHTFGTIVIKSGLSEDLLKTVATFMQTSLKPSVVPAEITLQHVQAAQQKQNQNQIPAEDIYLANWNKDGQYISLLYTLTPETSEGRKPKYIRAWIMPQGETVTDDQAHTFLKNIFGDSFLSTVGSVSCKQSTNPQPQETSPLTECAKMKTFPTGDLFGVTVRTPISLEPPVSTTPMAPSTPHVTVVSACFIPKDGVPFYTASSCI